MYTVFCFWRWYPGVPYPRRYSTASVPSERLTGGIGTKQRVRNIGTSTIRKKLASWWMVEDDKQRRTTQTTET